MEAHSNSTPDLPADILIEIFCRLPVKTLVRLSSACKFWNDLVRSDRIFIGCHLKQALKNTIRSASTNVFMYSVRDRKSDPGDTVQRFMKADENCLLTSFFIGSNIYLVGCINGIFCFYEYWSGDIYMWNPALHQCRMLPRCCDRFFDVVAFFSEPTNDDYIVLKIHNLTSQVHTYRLSSNSWKKINFPYHHPCRELLYIKDRVALVHNGGLHWLSRPYENYEETLFLNVYDLSMERFQIQQTLLSDHIPFKPYQATLGLIKGCICIFGSSDYFKYEVWMMKEYGAENSWTMQFEFPRYIYPRICLSGTSGKFMVKHEGYVVLYDPETKENEFVQDEVMPYDINMDYFFTDNYVESLVSVFPPAKRTVDETTSVSCLSYPSYTIPQRCLSGTRTTGESVAKQDYQEKTTVYDGCFSFLEQLFGCLLVIRNFRDVSPFSF